MVKEFEVKKNAAAVLIFMTVFVSLSSLAFGEENSCALPFEKMTDPRSNTHFALSDAINSNASLNPSYRSRYVVADLNTTNEAGKCRGVEESYPTPEESGFFEDPVLSRGGFPEFQSLVLHFYHAPLKRPPTLVFRGERLCIGQTISLCQIRNGQPALIAHFLTSSANGSYGAPLRTYYSEYNRIATRHWSSDRPYPAAQAELDAAMGGVDGRHLSGNSLARFKGKFEMANFLNFVPEPGFKGETQNGIHKTSGGERPGDDLGAPVSLGCIRLTDYASKLARWYIPLNSKFFIHYDKTHYKKLNDSRSN